jgi:hypothetical protein
MKGKILFLISLLVLAIFIAGCKEQAGEAGGKLKFTQYAGEVKAPSYGRKVPSCAAGTYYVCEGNVTVKTERAEDCTTREVSRFDCSPGYCASSSGTCAGRS